MSIEPKITKIFPQNAIAGGEITIEIEGMELLPGEKIECFANGANCRIVGASSKRVIASLPESDDSTAVIQIVTRRQESRSFLVNLGKRLVEEMHMVANPAIDPSDDSIVLTRSGSRGQQLPHTLYRLETDGFLDELPVEILNPTGIAFGPSGELFVTNRAEGTVCRIERGENAVEFASGLGIATGIAFDANGAMFVGDRSGTIYRVSDLGAAENFASVEPSVAAFHIAFAPDGRLFVTSPGFASHDSVYAIDPDGRVHSYVRGLGRPQGIAAAQNGDLYVAACFGGRHGIVKIDAQTQAIEHFVAGNDLVGICFTRSGEMIAATNDSLFSFDVGIYGTILNK